MWEFLLEGEPWEGQRIGTGPLALLASLMPPLKPSAVLALLTVGLLADAVAVPPAHETPQSSRRRRG